MAQYRALTKRISPLMLGIGIPASLRTLSQYLQQVIDTMYIGQYDSNALLSLSSVIVPFWMFESLWIGMASATTVMIAQRLGAKLFKEAGKVAQMTFIVGAVLSVVYFFLWWQNASSLLARLMNLQGDSAIFAVDYISIVSYVYLIRFVGLGTPASIMEALGQTKVIMIATMVQSITNIILDPILIWGWGAIPEMGIRGAAYATVIAELMAVIILSAYFWKKHILHLRTLPLFPLSFNFGERIKFGLPITIEVSLWSLSTSSIIAMMNYAFPLGGAIFNVGFLLSDMCYRLLYGFDVANLSLMGRSFGAKRKDRMIASLRSATRNKWFIGILTMFFLYIFQTPIVSLFSNDPQIIQTTLDNLLWILVICLSTISVGINMSTLNAMGYSRYNLYVSLVAIPLRAFMSYIVLFHTDFGVAGVWMATIIEEGLRVIATYIIRNIMLRRYWKLWEGLPSKNA